MWDETIGMGIAELEARIVEVRRQHRRCEYELACLLVEWDQRGGAASCGHTDTVGWARSVLGLEARETKELLRIGRRLPDLPRLSEVFAEGLVGWTHIREAIRVAMPETDAAWTERVLEVGARRLEREVASCKPGDLPPEPGDIELPSRVVLRFELATGDAMVVRKALAVLKAQAGDDADEGVLLASLARIALRESHTDEQPMPEERYRVVLQECPTCTHMTHVGQADGVHRIDRAVAEEAACDHEQVEAETGRLTHAIPPTTRRRVLHRDGYRCTVPQCRADLWVDVHHLRAREDGGDHADSNWTVLCTQHHRRVHEGRLRLWRDESGTLRAEPAHEEPPVAGTDVEALLDVLSFTVLDSGEVASCLGMKDGEARTLLTWLERRGEVVATPGGGWHRLAA